MIKTSREWGERKTGGRTKEKYTNEFRHTNEISGGFPAIILK